MSAITNISESWAGHSFQEVENHIKGYYPKKTIDITYSSLKSARDNGTLVPGQWYRITDYQTTINPALEPNAQSVNHQFDIIVRADDVNVLNENAFAAKHSGDTYFSKQNLAAWELKYTIDNINWSLRPTTVASSQDDYYVFVQSGTIEVDGTTYVLWKGNGNFSDDWCDYAISEDSDEGTTLYALYDIDEPEFSDESVGKIESLSYVSGTGKGTITWMKDEYDNECPYDFKNIQFKRWYTNDSKGRDAIDSKYMIADMNNPASGISADDEGDYIWAFTFSSDASGDTQTDTSLSGGVHNNVFGKYGDSLPNNVIYGYNTYGNTFGINCCYNSIGNNFNSNSIGNYFQYNTIGNYFQRNSIGNDFRYNTIGEWFTNNTIGEWFTNNSIGNSFYYNSIGNNCYRNSIGNSFFQNTIGNYFQYNTIGNVFQYNTIGNSFNSNSIGNYFNNNTIGNDTYNNSIGNDFGYNTIGNSCQQIRIQKDYVYYVIIENGNQYIDITSTQTTSGSSLLRNFTIAQGVNNTSTRKTISHNSVNDTFKTTYQPQNSQAVSV